MMDRIDNNFNFKNYNIHVFKGLANSVDMNWDQEIRFTITNNEESVRGELLLKPLWLFDEDEINDLRFDYKRKYQEGDYFQHTFITHPKRIGMGSIIHDFIIESKDVIGLNNIYSTCTNEDEHIITVEANNFWLKRVQLEKAAYDNNLNRYKITF